MTIGPEARDALSHSLIQSKEMDVLQAKGVSYKADVEQKRGIIEVNGKAFAVKLEHVNSDHPLDESTLTQLAGKVAYMLLVKGLLHGPEFGGAHINHEGIKELNDYAITPHAEGENTEGSYRELSEFVAKKLALPSLPLATGKEFPPPPPLPDRPLPSPVLETTDTTALKSQEDLLEAIRERPPLKKANQPMPTPKPLQPLPSSIGEILIKRMEHYIFEKQKKEVDPEEIDAFADPPIQQLATEEQLKKEDLDKKLKQKLVKKETSEANSKSVEKGDAEENEQPPELLRPKEIDEFLRQAILNKRKGLKEEAEEF